jgi:hypothetical protein
MLIVPVVASKGDILGTILMQSSKTMFGEGDKNVLETLSFLFASCIERARAPMRESHKNGFGIPPNLKAKGLLTRTWMSPSFNVEHLEESNFYKMAFWAFGILQVREEFSITNWKLYSFLKRVKEKSGDNWRRSLQRVQLLTVALSQSLALFSSFERLVLVSSLLAMGIEQQTNGPWFTLLSEDESSIAEFFAIASEPDIRIFEGVPKDIWKALAETMKSATTMDHRQILKQIQDQSDPSWYITPANHSLLFSFVLKAVILSDVARPSEWSRSDKLLSSIIGTDSGIEMLQEFAKVFPHVSGILHQLEENAKATPLAASDI